ncbi:hypothetical protein C8F01DRAFT_1183082 [Mycena amicta]|nr:hypothetical protein C8F01DRAFT_1183082 [Mycena amicta]
MTSKLDTAPSHSPCFSPELERKIFELAALANLQAITPLLLVARRVQIWVEPLRFRVVRLNDSAHATAFFREIQRKPKAYFLAVRHLLLESNAHWRSEHALEILEKCSSVVDLGTTFRFNGPELLPVLATLALRHLTTNLSDVFGDEMPIDPLHPALAHVTHLSLRDGIPVDDFDEEDESRLQCVCAAIPSLPALTHLRFDFCGEHEDVGFLTQLVEDSPRLQLLLLTEVQEEIDLHDNRVVLCGYTHALGRFGDEWERGARGEQDTWARAEEFVRLKREGVIGADELWLPVTHE